MVLLLFRVAYVACVCLFIQQRKNKLASRDVLHLIQKCSHKGDLNVAVKAMHYFQLRGVAFDHHIVSRFINLCVQADSPKFVTDMLFLPKYRIGAWLSKDSTQALYRSLLKTNDIEMMLKVEAMAESKGLAIQTVNSLRSMMAAANAAGTDEQRAAVLALAEKRLEAKKLEEFKAKIAEVPAPTA